jgi:hypothetical protein
MQVAILQPTYWARAHVWNRILTSDVFIWLDSVKFSRSATKWEDRTVVETTDGRAVALRLPLNGSRTVTWGEAGLNDGWRKHLATLTQCYSKRPHWQAIKPAVEAVYEEDAKTIDAVCWRSLEATASVLHPECRFLRSSTMGVESSKGELVLDLVKEVGGTSYLSGAPGMSYLPLDRFADAGVDVVVQDWQAPVTRHGLANPSVVDLLANLGPEATRVCLR